MSEVLTLEISTNVTEFPYEKKFPASMTLRDFKKKLELVVGALAETMKVELRDDDGKFVASLSNDTATLKALGVRDGMSIYIADSTGANEELKDTSMIEKYEIAEDAYAKREDSVRAFKQKLREEKERQEGVAMRDVEEEGRAVEGITVGARCEVRVDGQPARRGRVAYVGDTKFAAGAWVGVVYDEPVGKNDGSVKGERYFECAEKYGGFVRPTVVTVGEFPELHIDDDGMDEI